MTNRRRRKEEKWKKWRCRKEEIKLKYDEICNNLSRKNIKLIWKKLLSVIKNQLEKRRNKKKEDGKRDLEEIN